MTTEINLCSTLKRTSHLSGLALTPSPEGNSASKLNFLNSQQDPVYCLVQDSDGIWYQKYYHLCQDPKCNWHSFWQVRFQPYLSKPYQLWPLCPTDFFPLIIFISWRLITLQYCSGFCHTLTWISHGFTCVPHPEPLSHLPPHPIPSLWVIPVHQPHALVSCIQPGTGDLFHTW